MACQPHVCVCACVILSIVTWKLLLNIVTQYPLTTILKRFINYICINFPVYPCIKCYGHTNCLHIPIGREESNERKDKRIIMVQWVNFLRINSFAYPTQKLVVYIISRALHLAQLGLTARLVGRQNPHDFQNSL